MTRKGRRLVLIGLAGAVLAAAAALVLTALNDTIVFFNAPTEIVQNRPPPETRLRLGGLVETGSVYYAGGGVRYWLKGGDGQARSIGLRADARAQWRRNGVEFAGQTRVAPVIGVHGFFEF